MNKANLKELAKENEATDAFQFSFTTRSTLFIKPDDTITSAFNPLPNPIIYDSSIPPELLTEDKLNRLNTTFLKHLAILLHDQLKENNTTQTKTKEQTPTVVYVQSKEQTSTNSNPLANCTPEDFYSTKKVLGAALDSNPDLHTSNTLQNFIKNELPKLEKQVDALLKEELINQTKNRFNLLLERASSSTDVSVIYKALDLIDSLAYPNFEWDTTQVNLLYKKLND